MRGLDTPALLALLRGDRLVDRALGESKGAEHATTELNLWELHQIARRAPGPAASRRASAVERLRRKLVVIPIDAAATAFAQRFNGVATRALSHAPVTQLMIGAAEAHGCTEWWTRREAVRADRVGAVRIVHIDDLRK